MNITSLLLGLGLGAVIGLLAGWLLALQRSHDRVRRAEQSVARATAQLEATTGQQADHFRTLAADALTSNNEQFLALAHQRLAASQQEQTGALAAREQAVRELVEPLSKSVEAVRSELTVAERARAEANAAIVEQVRAARESNELLREQTSHLVTALRSSQVRGRWGETQLRRVVEAAGMLSHVDFVEQANVTTDDGRQRPDMIVRLAGGKQIVIDAKVALLAFLEASETKDPSKREERLGAHAKHMRTHVDQLSSKAYWRQFSPSPEFTVMFVPAETFLHSALDHDPGLVEYAFSRDVVIATPMTLLALLRTVAYAWRQESLAENAQQVLTLGKDLHNRLSTMGRHFDKLGRSIDAAARSYNQTVASLETRVLVTARRFTDLNVVDDSLDAPPPVDPHLSILNAPELVSDDRERSNVAVSNTRVNDDENRHDNTPPQPT